MRVYAGGFAVLGPGLDGWEAAREVLAGRRAYVPADLVPPAPAGLPPAERRRASAAVRLAVAAADAAAASSGLPAADLASVFGSSNGDGAVVGPILEALARPGPVAVSPTQFHNSVHNTPAAYWAIANGCRRPSVSLGCHDDTFAASLLRAAAETANAGHPVLLCVYDAPLPPPLAAARPTGASFAAAMVLTPGPVPASRAALDVRLVPEPPPPGSPEPRAEALRPLYHANAAARSLRLLEAVAGGEAGPVSVAYLGDSHLRVDLAPC